ncbi:MAG: caspase family protein [Thermoplasmatota archaeon]
MKKKISYHKSIALVIIVLLINISFISIVSSKPEKMSNTSTNDITFYAVIAACSIYENQAYNIPKKPFQPIPESKLMVLYNSLLNAENWQKENIILLLNENATKHNILSALEDMADIVTPDDIFLFSWSGHGSKVIENNSRLIHNTNNTYKSVICPYDMNIVNQTMVNYICSTELNIYFSNINAKGQCLIFECCLSGGLVITQQQNYQKNFNQPYTLNVDGENRVVIMSTPADFIGRATFTTGYPLINSLALVFDKYIQDENNNGFLSIQKAFKPARILTLIQSSFYYLGIWLYYLILYKINLNRGIPSIFTLLFRNNPAILATITTIQSFIVLQLFIKNVSGNYLLNWPNMRDDYQGDLPIILK